MRVRRALVVAVLVSGSAVAGVGAWLAYRYHGPAPPVEIYRGLTYGCDRLPETDQGGGLVHWVCADLTAPGVHLYATPLQPEALADGDEYRLRRVSTAVADDGLAAAVNATLFASDSWFVRLPGDHARAAETVVADGIANHVDPNTYLLWWDAAGLAHLQLTKPPSPVALHQAVWGIGGQEVIVTGGAVAPWVGPGGTIDHRTAIAADPDRHQVWILCCDRATYRLAGEQMVRLGAKLGLIVDGGTSTAMALGPAARGVRGGTVTGNWRPVATQFGFRADPLP